MNPNVTQFLVQSCLLRTRYFKTKVPTKSAMFLKAPSTVPAGEWSVASVCSEVPQERGFGGEGPLALHTREGRPGGVCPLVNVSGTLSLVSVGAVAAGDIFCAGVGQEMCAGVTQ